MDIRANEGFEGAEERGLPLWKRAMDLTFVMLMAPAILLVGVVVALIVKIGSPGRLFFMQERVGAKGREFLLYKFRTMKDGAETEVHRKHTQQLMRSNRPMTKLDAANDSRLIPLGGFLRATGMDELPQMLNVLRGEMSIVGPRPCLPYEFEHYGPWERRRLDSVPGLTGLWQVSGKNRTTFHRMVELDIEYFERRSLWLDLKIILKTLPALWVQWQDQRCTSGGETACPTGRVVKSV